MSNTIDKFLRLLNTATAVTVDDGAMLTGITAEEITGDPENQVVCFTWTDGEYDYMDINRHGSHWPLQDNKNHGLNVSHAFMVGASAKVAIVNVGMEAAYGTGTSFNKDRSTDYRVDYPFGYNTSRTYLSPYGETSYNYAFLYNDKIGQASSHGGGGGLGFGDGTGGFGLANTGYIKVSAGVAPMDKLNVGVDVLYLRASDAVINWGAKAQAKDLGWEVDAHADYKIYDNLNLNVTGGVFLPGGFYRDMRNWETEGDDNTADLTYGLETKLTVKF